MGHCLCTRSCSGRAGRAWAGGQTPAGGKGMSEVPKFPPTIFYPYSMRHSHFCQGYFGLNHVGKKVGFGGGRGLEGKKETRYHFIQPSVGCC